MREPDIKGRRVHVLRHEEWDEQIATAIGWDGIWLEVQLANGFNLLLGDGEWEWLEEAT